MRTLPMQLNRQYIVSCGYQMLYEDIFKQWRQKAMLMLYPILEFNAEQN